MERARNNLRICSASDGRAAALLVVAIARYDSSSRLASHPDRRVQIHNLFLTRPYENHSIFGASVRFGIGLFQCSRCR